jgi:hypothetical protein
MPLEVRCYDAGTGRADDHLQWEWEAKSFEALPGAPLFPIRSDHRTFAPDERGRARPLNESEIGVESITVDFPYPEAQFRPVEEPGVQVLDTIRNLNYAVPGPKAPEPPQRAGLAVPDAIAPAPWTATASRVGLSFSVLLLAAAAVAWVRRRS